MDAREKEATLYITTKSENVKKNINYSYPTRLYFPLNIFPLIRDIKFEQ